MTLMRKCLKDYCQTVHNPEYLAIDAINSSNASASNAKISSLINSTPHQFSYNDYLNKTNNNNKSTNLNNNFQYNNHPPTSFFRQQANNTNNNQYANANVNALNSVSRNLKKMFLNVPNQISSAAASSQLAVNASNLKANSNPCDKSINHTFLTTLSSPVNTSAESTSSTSTSSSSSSASSSSSLSGSSSYHNNIMTNPNPISNPNPNPTQNNAQINSTITTPFNQMAGINMSFDLQQANKLPTIDNKQTYV
jgi:hypothetical protein